MNQTLVVVGSLSIDFVVQVDRLPAAGETVIGRNFLMNPGGKGANQASAAGKLGGTKTRTRMIGRVGHDLFGDQQKAALAAAGVDVGAIHSTRLVPTGVALIWVDSNAQNSIVIDLGANATLLPSEVEAMRPTLEGARYALFQLECPVETAAAALALAREMGVSTILDPAPARPLSREILSLVDILTPNETEASILLGRPPARLTVAEAPAIAARLLSTGVGAVVLKLGDQGCYYQDRTRSLHSPGFPVHAVDATAAGDTFNAALAVALAEDQPIEQALRFANAAAGLSVTRPGAQASVPTRAEVDALLAQSVVA